MEETVNVARHLTERARQHPDRCALKAPAGRTASGSIRYVEKTFAALDAESDAAARHLLDKGIGRGAKVLLMVKPGLELAEITFALLKIGAAPVVIDPGMGFGSFLRCVRHTAPQALISNPLVNFASRFFPGSFSSVQARIVTGVIFRQTVEQMLAAHQSEPLAAAPTRAGDLAAVLFTSGSTGPAKGVCYEHGMFEAQLRLLRDFYKIEPGEVDLPMLPVFALFNPALGVTTVIPEMNPSRPAEVDPLKIVQAIHECGVTNSFGSPVLWGKIGRYCLAHGVKFPRLRRILMAGAPVPPEVIRMFGEIMPGGVVHTPYGATECLPVSSISGREVLGETWKLTEQGKGTCVGRPLPGMTAKIIKIEDGPIETFDPALELPQGSIGEIAVTGPVVTKEYDRREEETRRAKMRDAAGRVWHRMGDLGWLDPQGRLWFCGRKAERVQTAAGTLYTGCCEAVFNRHPHVFRSALIGLGAPPGQTPAVVIEPEKGKFPARAAARDHFLLELRQLAGQNETTKNIARFFFCKKFPTDVRHNAKIHRLTLARRYGGK